MSATWTIDLRHWAPQTPDECEAFEDFMSTVMPAIVEGCIAIRTQGMMPMLDYTIDTPCTIDAHRTAVGRKEQADD